METVGEGKIFFLNVSFADNKVNGGLEEEGVEYDNMEAVAYLGKKKGGCWHMPMAG